MSTTTKLACSLCGKSQDEVAKLVAGPGVNICDSCVTLASAAIAEADKQDEDKEEA